jgi:uncharacterized RDD family membrane protein YckC
LSLIDAAPSSQPHVAPSSAQFAADLDRLPLFGSDEDDQPLVSASRPPRPPLAVRRATPEVPRLRNTQAQPRMPMLDLAPTDQSLPPPRPSMQPGAHGRGDERTAGAPVEVTEPAAMGTRLLAAAIDLVILAAIDAVVIYFTMQICGVDLSEAAILPKGPLIAFLLVQNGGYLVAFTAGGQTLGKMLTGIRVVPAMSGVPLDIATALVRTLVWTVLAVPAGLGFLTAFTSGDRRGLHDRLAGTKVVRASA